MFMDLCGCISCMLPMAQSRRTGNNVNKRTEKIVSGLAIKCPWHSLHVIRKRSRSLNTHLCCKTTVSRTALLGKFCLSFSFRIFNPSFNLKPFHILARLVTMGLTLNLNCNICVVFINLSTIILIFFGSFMCIVKKWFDLSLLAFAALLTWLASIQLHTKTLMTSPRVNPQAEKSRV